MATTLLEAIRSSVLICDGAMGTQLMARGMASGECGELWNINRPNDIRAVHAAYRAAGCQLLTTNTFGGTTYTLGRHHQDQHMTELNRAGATLAREALTAKPGPAWVLGDVGPFGGFLEPVGDTPADELRKMFLAQCQALKEGGADAIIVETMVDPAEVEIAVRAAKEIADWVVIATYAFNKSEDEESGGFRTIMGTTVAQAMQAAIAAGADVVGANCGTALDLEDYVRLAERMTSAAGRTPVIIQPNAGAPQMVDGKMIHPATPHDMAAIVPELRSIGVRIIGGCCGTSPAHLKAMAEAVTAVD